MQPDNSTLEKIRKLLALAERAGTDAEAEAAMGRAQAMMQRHAITEAMARGAGAATADEIVTRHIAFGKCVGRDMKLSLLAALCRAHRCQCWHTPGRAAFVCGFESDAVAVEMLWTSLLLQCDGAAARAMKSRTPAERSFYADSVEAADAFARRSGWTPDGVAEPRFGQPGVIALRMEPGATFRKGFVGGFCAAAGRRAKEMGEESVAQYEADTGTSTALVLVDRAEQVAAHVAANHRLGRGRSSHSGGSAAAHAAGRSAGERAAHVGARLGGQRQLGR